MGAKLEDRVLPHVLADLARMRDTKIQEFNHRIADHECSLINYVLSFYQYLITIAFDLCFLLTTLLCYVWFLSGKYGMPLAPVECRDIQRKMGFELFDQLMGRLKHDPGHHYQIWKATAWCYKCKKD